MRDRWRRLPYPVTVAVLATVVLVGVLTGGPQSSDRARDLSEQLRCPVCQGGSVADSPSDTAIAIREQIDEMVADGRTDEEILDHYVARYGRWVLLRPPAAGNTLLIWLLPGLVAAGGAIVVATRRRPSTAIRELTPDERAAIDRALTRVRDDDARST
jgi:cytochrome c-type biogenesis protein CcmH